MQLKFKILTVSLLVLGLSTSIFAKPTLQCSYQKIEEYKLDNGLKVILLENSKESKVFMNMIYQTGSLNDPAGKGGMAHLLEHLAFKGTKNIKGDEFQKRLNQYTLSHNASTDYYITQYTNEVRSEQKSIDEILNLEAERMDKLVLQKKFVPSEIEIVKRERELTSDQPLNLLVDKIFKALYGNKDLGREPIGDLAELESINMDELNKFYRNWYAPNNAVLVVSGKFNKAALLKTLDRKFGVIPAREIPIQAIVPRVDVNKVKNQTFVVEKGSNYQKMNFYISPRNPKIEASLDVAPLLFSMEPSGYLYKNMVDTGVVDDVMVAPWNIRDMNLMIVSADYLPSQNVKKIDKVLISNIEGFELFNESELNRVKKIFKNEIEDSLKDASKIGKIISDSVALNNGDWIQYFKKRDALQNLDANGVNQQLKTYFKSENRVSTDIKPTSEVEKKATQMADKTISQSLLSDIAEKPEPLKDLVSYKKEVSNDLKRVTTSLMNVNNRIERGKFKNGLEYAIYKTKTNNDQSYANIVVNFGTAQSLFKLGEVLELTSYLIMHGSERYSRQDIADKDIEANGEVLVVLHSNSIEFKVVADKDKFIDYLKFYLDVIKTPTFEKSQFDLVKTKFLNHLDRSYTEPESVTKFAINKIVNDYPEGDLRAFSMPESTQKSIKKISNQQVKEFYKKYVNMSNAQVVVTGEVDVKEIKDILTSQLANWNGSEKYEPIGTIYKPVVAQKHHLFAEQREFGNYNAQLALAVGAENADIPAMYVLSHILGESQLSSRLGKELREKNTLVYGFTEYIIFDEYKDSGYIDISANYTAGKSNLVSQVVQKVFKDLLKNGVTVQEVESAKADLLKKMATGLENTMSINELLAPQMKHNRDLKYIANQYQQIANISKADVDAVIHKYIKLDQLVEVAADQYGK